MKKTFPIIIALITLSLMGIIYIQVSWLRNLAFLREEQLKEKLSAVIQQVGEELVVQRSDAFNNLGRMPDMIFINSFLLQTGLPFTRSGKNCKRLLYVII